MIDSTIASGDASSLLLAFSELRYFAQKRFTAEVANSATLLKTFPFKEFQVHKGLLSTGWAPESTWPTQVEACSQGLTAVGAAGQLRGILN